MSTEDRGQLRRDMAEAAALPAADPGRREVMRRVQEAGRWAEDEWVALLDTDERLRVELPRVSVPAGLEERLLAIPQDAALMRPGRWRWPVAVAAALVLLWGGLAVLFLSPRESTRIRQIGLIAIGDHMAGPRLTIETADRQALAVALKPQVHFDVKLPGLGQEFRLLGGRKCSFERHAVVYTRWERSGDEYSLYQFCPRDFGLPTEFSRRTVVSEDGGTAGKCDAVVWTEGGCAYVLVAERDAFVPPLARAVRSERNLAAMESMPVSVALDDHLMRSPL